MGLVIGEGSFVKLVEFELGSDLQELRKVSVGKI